MKRLVISSAAKDDLSDIWLYTARQWSVDQAERYVDQLLTACEDLAAGIKIGMTVDDLRPGHFRSFSQSHTIFYKHEAADDLVIVRILHQSMNPDDNF